MDERRRKWTGMEKHSFSIVSIVQLDAFRVVRSLEQSNTRARTEENLEKMEMMMTPEHFLLEKENFRFHRELRSETF